MVKKLHKKGSTALCPKHIQSGVVYFLAKIIQSPNLIDIYLHFISSFPHFIMDLGHCVFPNEQVGCDVNADSDIIDSGRALKTRANILAWQTMQPENQHDI